MEEQAVFEATIRAILDLIADRVEQDVIDDIEAMTYEDIVPYMTTDYQGGDTPPRVRPPKRPGSQ